MYDVYLERSAERDLKKFVAKDFHRLISYIKSLAQNLRPSGCRKITGSKSDWRIRVGDYRVIYEIDEEEKTVKVMRVRHHREIYR